MRVEDQRRFEIEAHEYRSVHGLTLACARCPWTAILDSPLTLDDIIDRANEHIEVCP